MRSFINAEPYKKKRTRRKARANSPFNLNRHAQHAFAQQQGRCYRADTLLPTTPRWHIRRWCRELLTERCPTSIPVAQELEIRGS